jgi:hypothetical protein
MATSSIYIPQLEDEDEIDLFGGASFAVAANDPFQPFQPLAASSSRPATPRKASLSSQRQHKPTGSSSSSTYDHPLPLSASQTRKPPPRVDAHAPLEVGLYMVLDAFFEKAEQKIGDILGRPIVSRPLVMVFGSSSATCRTRKCFCLSYWGKAWMLHSTNYWKAWLSFQGSFPD